MAALIQETIAEALAGLPLESVRRTFREQDEFVFLPRLLPAAVVDALVQEVEAVRPEVHRNWVPRHKKGGSVSFYTLVGKAPATLALYGAPALLDFLSGLAGAPLLPCPEDDPHRCALYFYTEPGDHMGFHYDTSYYRGARYTVLLGLVDRSAARLAVRLYRDNPARETRELRLATEPGSMVIFNGDRLYHAVTPLGPDEERVVLTMEYVTDPRMSLLKRFVSNMKDAIAYFGLRALVRRRPVTRGEGLP
jgi:hypothetical protein